MGKEYELILAVVLAIALNYIPYVGKFFKVFNTLVHENAHAFMSLIASGEVVSIHLFSNAEGSATTKPKNSISKFLIALSGYVFASVFSFVLAYWVYIEAYGIILYAFLTLAVLNLLLWVRNTYGVIWLIVICLGIGSIFYFDLQEAKKYTALLISAIVVIDAFVSACIILYLSIKNPRQSGDAKSLQQFTYLPAFFWGLIFFLQATFFLLLSVHLFLPLPFLSSIW